MNTPDQRFPDPVRPPDRPPDQDGPAYLPLRDKTAATRRYRRMTAEEKDSILKMHGAGMGPARIGKLLDRDPAIVRRTLNGKGVMTPKLRWNGPEALRLLNGGMPVEEVSRIVGKPVSAIRQYAVRHGGSRE